MQETTSKAGENAPLDTTLHMQAGTSFSTIISAVTQNVSKDSQNIAPSLPPWIGNDLSKSCAKSLLLPSPLLFRFSKLSEFCFINR